MKNIWGNNAFLTNGYEKENFKNESVVLTGKTSTRNVYICEIFSCYSGYQSVFLLELCTFRNRTNTWVSSAPLHFTSCIQPICANTWSLVQYTALRLGPVTLQATLSRFLWTKEGSWGEEASIPTTTSASRARWTLKGYPALQEAMVCSQSATKEGQDNNLLVAMK